MKRTTHTAHTLKDGSRYRALVMRRDGSPAYEGPRRSHQTKALAEAVAYIKGLSRL